MEEEKVGLHNHYAVQTVIPCNDINNICHKIRNRIVIVILNYQNSMFLSPSIEQML